MLIEGCKTISATPSKASAKVLLFCEICKGKGYFLKFAGYPWRKKKEKEKNLRGDAAKAAWRSVGLIFLRRFLGCPSDFVRSFSGHGPVMVMCFPRHGC